MSFLVKKYLGPFVIFAAAVFVFVVFDGKYTKIICLKFRRANPAISLFLVGCKRDTLLQAIQVQLEKSFEFS